MSSRLAQLAQQMLSPIAAPAAAADQPAGGASVLRGYPYMVAQQKTRITTIGLALGSSGPLEWFTLNDVVMGGQSESSCEPDGSGGLSFSGVISTVGGGFCSCRTHEASIAPTVESANAIRLVYTSDDALYKLTLSAESMTSRGLNWQYQLPENGSGKHTAIVPLSGFKASLHGRDMPGHTLEPAKLTSIGLNSSVFDMHGQPIAERKGGAFQMTLHSLEWVVV